MRDGSSDDYLCDGCGLRRRGAENGECLPDDFAAVSQRGSEPRPGQRGLLDHWLHFCRACHPKHQANRNLPRATA